MKQIVNVIIFGIAGLILINCKPTLKASNMNNQKVGGTCTYQKIVGEARLLSIEPAPASEYNCTNNPQRIKFVFIPSIKGKYKFPNYSDTNYIRISGGMNPSMAWIKANKLTIGKELKCSRTEVTKGTCSPVVFEFPEINLSPANGCN